MKWLAASSLQRHSSEVDLTAEEVGSGEKGEKKRSEESYSFSRISAWTQFQLAEREIKEVDQSYTRRCKRSHQWSDTVEIYILKVNLK